MLDGAVIVLSWAAMLSRLSSLRPDAGHVAAARWLWLHLLGLSLAITLRLPALDAALGRVAGVPSLAWLVRSVAVLTAAWAMLAMLASLREPTAARRSIRNWGLLLGATAGVMISLFAATPNRPSAQVFLLHSGHTPLLATCVTVYLAVLGLASVKIARGFWAYARLADRGYLRSGLWLTAVGGMFSMAALVHHALILVAHRLQFGDVLAPLHVGRRILCAGGIVLIVLGATVPAWSVRATSWLRDYRDHRRLYALWRATTRRTHRRLAASFVDMVTVGSLHYRVYRRIRETRDAMLELRLRADPRLAAVARQGGSAVGLRGPELAAYAEAVVLVQALRSQHGAAVDETVVPPASSGASDRQGEVWFLAAVGAHLTAMLRRGRSRTVPVVKALLS